MSKGFRKSVSMEAFIAGGEANPAPVAVVPGEGVVKVEVPVENAPLPWADIDPDATKPFNVRLPLVLHTKLVFLTENLRGRNSIHSLILEATEASVKALLKDELGIEE